MNKENYEDVIVQKPWGHEYLLYSNDNIALWHLYINKGASTSLHSHPKKKTGLAILSGGVELYFLNSKRKLFPLETVMIHKGVFHSTKAITGDIQLLEIESPNDKEDIIRLKDRYGRAGTKYEDKSFHTKNTIKTTLELGENKINGHILNLIKLNTIQEIKETTYDIFIILDGNIESKGTNVVAAGDIISRDNLLNIAPQFTFNPILVIGICLEN